MEAVKSSGGGDVLLEQEVAVQVVEAGAAVSSATCRSLKLLVELRLKPSTPAKVNGSLLFSLYFSTTYLSMRKSRGIVNGLHMIYKKLIMLYILVSLLSRNDSVSHWCI